MVCRPSSGPALSHPDAHVQSVPERHLLWRWEHQLPLQERHHLPRKHGRRHHHLLHRHRESYSSEHCRLIHGNQNMNPFYSNVSSVHSTDHHGGGLPRAHQASALQLPVQPVPVSPLQGGGNLPVRGSRQPIADRPGQVHHRSPPSELLSRVRSGQLHRVRAAHQLHRQPSQRDWIQVLIPPTLSTSFFKKSLLSSEAGILEVNFLSVFLPLRLSFYSGHSSFGMYSMLFLSVSLCLWSREMSVYQRRPKVTHNRRGVGWHRHRRSADVWKHHCCNATHCTMAGRWQVRPSNPLFCVEIVSYTAGSC